MSDNWNTWEDRGGRAGNFITRHPFLSLFGGFAALLAIGAVLAFIGGVFDLAGGHVENQKQAISGPNVKEQNRKIIDLWESMKASADNACDAQSIQKERGDPTLVEDTALAYNATYRDQQREYNRIMANRFEAGLARTVPVIRNLSDLKRYPRVAPDLEDRMLEKCPTKEQLEIEALKQNLDNVGAP